MPAPMPVDWLSLTVLLTMVMVALPDSAPSLMMPPPAPAELPVMVQLLTVSVAWSFRMPPPNPELAALVMVRLAMVTTMLELTWNTRLVPPPLTASRLAPGPRMVTFLVTGSSPLVKTMVAGVASANVIVAPGGTQARAARNVPGLPSSAVLETTELHIGGAGTVVARTR